jgi:acetyltransferase-like isoleucine patch superfamily enzyme
MFHKIKYRAYSSINQIVERVYFFNQKIRIKLLRRFPKNQISLSFSLGKYSSIIIKGEENMLVIADGVRCKMFCNFLIYPNANLKINNNVFFNNYCSVTCLGKIEIGENTLFGEGVKLYDHNHKHSFLDGSLKVNPNDFKIGSIKIGKNCWIGSNVIILKDVEIGDNVIIGANCLIFKSIPSNTMVRSSLEIEQIVFDSNKIAH